MGKDEAIDVSQDGSDYTVILPDDAILFRDTTGSFTTSGTLTVQYLSSATPSYQFSGGTEHVIDLESAGFETRDATQGITADEMRSRGWISDDGLSQLKLGWIGDSGGCTATVSGSLSSYVDTPTSNDTYYYRITATNPDGDSQMASNIVTVSTPGAAPAQPTTVLYHAFDDGSYGIEWGSQSDGNEANFSVWRSTSSDFSTGNEKLYTANRGQSSYVDTTRAPSTTYYYRVVATNPFSTESSDLGDASNAAAVTNPISFLGTDGATHNAGTATSADLTFPYGSAIHVFLNEQEITSYGSLTSRFTWNFDPDNIHDPNDPYRTTDGFNAAHIYDDTSGGTETIQLVIGQTTSSSFTYQTYSMTVSLTAESALNTIKVSNSGDGTGGTYSLSGANLRA